MDNLNKNQLEAINHLEGPLLIIAGPGSGKTKTIIERTISLLNKNNVSPSNIILATFTDKAARELITRISKKIDKNLDISQMYLGTIHSIALRIIDENLEASYLEKEFKILDDLDQHFFIYKNIKVFENLKGYEIFFEKYPANNPWEKSGRLKKWINKISEEDMTFTNPNSDILFLSEAHSTYLHLLTLENTIDFPNIQKEALRILKDNKNILDIYQEKIKYIVIDEYQDTNYIQEKLFLLIADKYKNICVVGDDDQGIYRFRGASIKNILNFSQNFEKGFCKKITLDINYRSNKDIVNFSNEWINSLNWDGWRYNKNLISGKEDKNKTLGVVKLSSNINERDWRENIYKFLIDLKNFKKIEDYNQVAFLFSSIRNNKVKRLASYLESKGINIYSPRANNFFERDEINFVLGFFISIFSYEERLKFNIYYNDCFNFFRKQVKGENDEKLINFIREFRKEVKLILKTEDEMFLPYKNFLDIFYALFQFDSFKKYLNFDNNHILENSPTYNLGIFSEILNKFDNLCKIKNLSSNNLNKILPYFFEYHLNFLKQHGVNETEVDNFPKGAVSFLTIHQSKGLEFPFIIVGSLDKKLDLPSTSDETNLNLSLSRSFEPPDRINEFDFWRLFYVGFSRAKNLLALTAVENEAVPCPSPAFKNIYKNLSDVRLEEFKLHNLNFDLIETNKLKKTFSFTGDINHFNFCPLFYKFLKVYNFKTNQEESQFFGSLVHLTLDEINKKFVHKIILSEEEIKDIYKMSFNNLRRKNNLSLSASVLKKGYSDILDYVNNYASIHSYIKDSEIKVTLVDDNFILEGIADLVIEKENEIEIVDFKTGYKKDSHSTYIDQLKIYSYLLSIKYEKPITKAQLFYINETKENKIFKINISEKDISIAKEYFNLIINNVINNNFNLTTESENNCKFCLLKDYCNNEKTS